MAGAPSPARPRRAADGTRGAPTSLAHLPAALPTAGSARPRAFMDCPGGGASSGPAPRPRGREMAPAAALPGDPHGRVLPGSERASRAATASGRRGRGRGLRPGLHPGPRGVAQVTITAAPVSPTRLLRAPIRAAPGRVPRAGPQSGTAVGERPL